MNKKNILIYPLILTFFLLIALATDDGDSATNNSSNLPFNTGQVYDFFDGMDDKLSCYECDPCWHIKFLDDQNAEVWSTPCSGSSSLMSCSSDAKYNYDKESKVVTIISVSNNNVSYSCLSKFTGKWSWKDGKFGMRFYAENYNDVDFH